jgi:hypothetical protein
VEAHELELALVCLIVLVLVTLAGLFGWRQGQTLRGLGRQEELSVEDRVYYRHQAWRRLVGCMLMIVLAGLLSGWYLLGFDTRTLALSARGNSADTVAEAVQRGAAMQRFLNLASFYVIFTLLVLLALVCVGAADVLAIRRFGLRHYRKIQSDRRAMIDEQVSIMRSQRNGHH